jgi:hypothetical protein
VCVHTCRSRCRAAARPKAHCYIEKMLHCGSMWGEHTPWQRKSAAGAGWTGYLYLRVVGHSQELQAALGELRLDVDHAGVRGVLDNNGSWRGECGQQRAAPWLPRPRCRIFLEARCARAGSCWRNCFRRASASVRAILKEKWGLTGECEGLRLLPFLVQGRRLGELPDVIAHCTEEERSVAHRQQCSWRHVASGKGKGKGWC